jgi:hypothetical protein
VTIKREADEHYESYTTQFGDGYNAVTEAASRYLAAAELLHAAEVVTASSWYTDGDWYVVHHLSVIATELFMKSARVVVSYPPVRDGSGPDYELVKHAYDRHPVDWNSLPPRFKFNLEQRLSPTQYALVANMALVDISRGRYPYGYDKREAQFPAGEQGRAIAEEWLGLARALATILGAARAD